MLCVGICMALVQVTWIGQSVRIASLMLQIAYVLNTPFFLRIGADLWTAICFFFFNTDRWIQ